MVINTLRNLNHTTDNASDMTALEQMPSFEDHIQKKTSPTKGVILKNRKTIPI